MNHKVGTYLQYLKDQKPDVIQDTLESMAYTIVEEETQIPLTEEELVLKKADLAEMDIKIDAIEEKKKEKMDEFKAELTEPKQRRTQLLEEIKHKSVRGYGKFYLMAERITNTMYSYDTSGKCVSKRPMTEAEMQANILE